MRELLMKMNNIEHFYNGDQIVIDSVCYKDSDQKKINGTSQMIQENCLRNHCLFENDYEIIKRELVIKTNTGN